MNLREKLIRLAHAKPELRRHVQALLKTSTDFVLIKDAAQPLRIVFNMYRNLVLDYGTDRPLEMVQGELDLAGSVLWMQIKKVIRLGRGSTRLQKGLVLELITSMMYFITKIAEVEAHKHISPEVASAGYEEDIKHDENLWSDLSRSTRSDRR
jgi:hypothetical protein